MYADRITDSMRHAIDETEPPAGQAGRVQRGTRLDPQPLRKKITDILEQVYAEAEDAIAPRWLGSQQLSRQEARR